MSKPSFQKNMYLYPSLGIPGQKASNNPAAYFIGNPLCADVVNTGAFVWVSDDVATKSGTGKPAGIVEALLEYPNFDFANGASIALPPGSSLTIMTRGDMYVVSGNVASAGNKVFAKLADGTLETHSAGTNVSGFEETDFVVVVGGSAGDIIIISTWA